MARRLFNGNEFSENGWPYVDEGSCRWVKISADAQIEIQDGVPATVMGAFARDYDANIEPIFNEDSACWTPGNSVATSNHPGATAMDLRWDSHKFQVRGTFNAAQQATIDELLDWYEGLIFWGGRWQSPVDEMHWQMGYDTYDQNADAPFPKCQDFINRKIRADGFSTFRRGDAPSVDRVAILADAMGNRAGVDYASKLAAVSQCLNDCGCTTVDRIAMWMGQVGEESGGLQWMEEIADGSEYEGRGDLGNTQPGDGSRFKGRGPIQVTGRHNYTVLSQWAFDHGLVGSPTFFVDDPGQLASDIYGFIGVTWYWTTQRPMNDAADARDIQRATRYVNGGLNGLQDRTDRWNHCLSMGDQLLALVTTQPTTPGDDMALVPQQEWDDFKRKWDAFIEEQPTLSPFRPPGAPVTAGPAQFIRWSNGGSDFQDKKDLAVLGHQPTIDLLNQIAVLTDPDRQADAALARNVLAAAKRAWTAPTAANNTAPAAAPAAAPAVDNTRELADAYAEIARLQAENASLRQDAAARPAVVWSDQPVSTEVATVGSTGDVAKTVIDAVEGWTDKALALDTKQRAALTASMTVLQLNGNQQ